MSERAAGAASDASPVEAHERQLLLRAARAAIAARLGGPGEDVTPPVSGALAERRGAFVTLRRRRDQELRGCVGRMVSEESLLETVRLMAVAAATQDGRFDPLSLEELPHVSLEISALGPLSPIRPDEVEVGRHGLLVSRGRRRGVLLPQVPVEHGWDREAFLAHACLKAGLEPDAWEAPDTELLGFTATVFGEEG